MCRPVLRGYEVDAEVEEVEIREMWNRVRMIPCLNCIESDRLMTARH